MNKIVDLLGLSEFKEKIISLIPTKVSQLNNDSEYVKQTDVEDLKKFVSDGKELVADAITEKGVETAADATFATMAENIGQIETGSDIVLQEKNVSPKTSVQNVTPDSGYDGLSKVIVNKIRLTKGTGRSFITNDPNEKWTTALLDNTVYDGFDQVEISGVLGQEKTVNPSTSQQNIVPDSGYGALTKVTVNAMKLQGKVVAPSNSAQSIYPDSGYNGLSDVTVNSAPLQNKTVTPTSSIQTVTPDSGFYGLGSVSVAAVKNGFTKTQLYSGNSKSKHNIDVTSFANYKNFTIDNFVFENVKLERSIDSSIAVGTFNSGNIIASYDATSGTLTAAKNLTRDNGNGYIYYISYKIYVIE